MASPSRSESDGTYLSHSLVSSGTMTGRRSYVIQALDFVLMNTIGSYSSGRPVIVPHFILYVSILSCSILSLTLVSRTAHRHLCPFVLSISSCLLTRCLCTSSSYTWHPSPSLRSCVPLESPVTCGSCSIYFRINHVSSPLTLLIMPLILLPTVKRSIPFRSVPSYHTSPFPCPFSFFYLFSHRYLPCLVCQSCNCGISNHQSIHPHDGCRSLRSPPHLPSPTRASRSFYTTCFNWCSVL